MNNFFYQISFPLSCPLTKCIHSTNLFLGLCFRPAEKTIKNIYRQMKIKAKCSKGRWKKEEIWEDNRNGVINKLRDELQIETFSIKREWESWKWTHRYGEYLTYKTPHRIIYLCIFKKILFGVGANPKQNLVQCSAFLSAIRRMQKSLCWKILLNK